MVVGYLLTHVKIQHSVGQGGQVWPQPPPPGESQTYQVSFPAALTRLWYPVPGLQGGGIQQDQPPGSLFTPPCVICYCDPGVFKSALPPLPSMWYVHLHTGIEWKESRH